MRILSRTEGQEELALGNPYPYPYPTLSNRTSQSVRPFANGAHGWETCQVDFACQVGREYFEHGLARQLHIFGDEDRLIPPVSSRSMR